MRETLSRKSWQYKLLKFMYSNPLWEAETDFRGELIPLRRIKDTCTYRMKIAQAILFIPILILLLPGLIVARIEEHFEADEPKVAGWFAQTWAITYLLLLLVNRLIMAYPNPETAPWWMLLVLIAFALLVCISFFFALATALRFVAWLICLLIDPGNLVERFIDTVHFIARKSGLSRIADWIEEKKKKVCRPFQFVD